MNALVARITKRDLEIKALQVEQSVDIAAAIADDSIAWPQRDDVVVVSRVAETDQTVETIAVPIVSLAAVATKHGIDLEGLRKVLKNPEFVICTTTTNNSSGDEKTNRKQLQALQGLGSNGWISAINGMRTTKHKDVRKTATLRIFLL